MTRAPIKHRAGGGPVDPGRTILLAYPVDSPTAAMPVQHETRRSLARARRRERAARTGLVLTLLLGGALVAVVLLAAVLSFAPGLMLLSVAR